MEKRKIKTYDVNGKQMMFNASTFADYCKKKANQENKKIHDYNLFLGDHVGASDETVRAWRTRKNGPLDIDMVKKIAGFWEIDYKLLLVEVDDMIMNTKFDDRTRTVVVECYKELEDFFDDFSNDCGRFSDLLYINQLFITGMFYEGIITEKPARPELLDVDGDTDEERVRVSKAELFKCSFALEAEVEKMKRRLRRNVLELPRFIYDQWDEFLTTAYNNIDYLFKRGIPESREDLEDGESDDIANDEEKENLYNVFFEFCKENIEPLVH